MSILNYIKNIVKSARIEWINCSRTLDMSESLVKEYIAIH